MNILELNNIDLPGHSWNGFDLQRHINADTIHTAAQIVTYKLSDDKNVVKFYENQQQIEKEWLLNNLESAILSTHNLLSFTSGLLAEKDHFQNADVVHYHLTHNTKLSLCSFAELVGERPSVWTIHDPWAFTGRCVYPQECEKWLTGCHDCDCLDNLFPLPRDNCDTLWKLKKKVYEKLDIDIIVTTPWMMDFVRRSPLTQCFKHVHLVPFGIDLQKFQARDKAKARKRLGLPEDAVVLFHRSQMAMKGTEFVVEALQMLANDNDFDCSKVTLLTCDEIGNCDCLKSKYNVVELGNIEDDDILIDAYSACDVFLMPSRGESFGFMAVEAMACSRPVVVFDNSALPSVTFAPECGVLVENKNSAKLAEAIKRLAQDEGERERRGKLGRKLAEEHYSLDVYHKKILEVYEAAYERQKDKLPPKFDYEIDFSEKNTQVLLKRLKMIFTRLFPQEEPPQMLFGVGEDGDDAFKIDFSTDSAIAVVNEFNREITKYLKKIQPSALPLDPYNAEIVRLQALVASRTYRVGYVITKPFKILRKIVRKIERKKVGKVLMLPFRLLWRIFYGFAKFCYKALRKCWRIAKKVAKK